MNPLKRDNNSVRATDHENRIQGLERRFSDEFPKFYSNLTAETTISGTGTFTPGWDFPDPPCTDPNTDLCCAYRTDGDYFLLPCGWWGVFHVYMYHQPTNGSLDEDFYTDIVLEVWEDDVSIGTLLGRGYEQHTFTPPPLASASGFLTYTTHIIACGSSVFEDNQRFAIKPVFINNGAGTGVVGVGPFIIEFSERDTAVSNAAYG